MTSDGRGGDELPEDVPACYVIELEPERYVVCQIKTVLKPDERALAEQFFELFARSKPHPLRAVPLPDHLMLTRFDAQMGD